MGYIILSIGALSTPLAQLFVCFVCSTLVFSFTVDGPQSATLPIPPTASDTLSTVSHIIAHFAPINNSILKVAVGKERRTKNGPCDS